MKKIMFCVAVAAVGFVNCRPLLAHSSEFPTSIWDGPWRPNTMPSPGSGIRTFVTRTLPTSILVHRASTYILDLPVANAPVMIYAHGGGGDRGDKGLVDGP